MNLEHPTVENAIWIWMEGVSGPNTYVEFRHRLAADCVTASIQLSAETSFRLWLNGKALLFGPPREAPPYFYYETLDLLPHLRPGENDLRIVSHHQGENSQSYQAGRSGLLVGGHCMLATGEVRSFAELDQWECRRLNRYRADSHRLFFCLGFSEHVDFAAAESDWAKPELVSTHPWSERSRALPSDLPRMRETIRYPHSTEQSKEGLLIDMGGEVSGYISLKVSSEQRGTLNISYAEGLEDGCVNPRKGGMQYTDRLKLPVGEITWRSYEKRAFRYLFLDRLVEVRSIEVLEHTWPYERQWEKAPGDLEEQIREVSARTIELNTEDLLTDCPWRERAQYFDCQHYMGAMQLLFGTLEPIRRFLGQFPRGADETGLLRMCYPSPADTLVIPDFSMSYSGLLLRYLELSRDLETVRANLPFAERGVTVFRKYEDSNGLITDVPGWIFLDNTFELPKYPRSAGLNAVYHGSYLALARLCAVCEQKAQAEEYADYADRLRAAFRKTFLREGRLLDADATPEHEKYKQWVYHYSAESGRWSGGSFHLRVRFKRLDWCHPLLISTHGGGRAWIDGNATAHIDRKDPWSRSAVFERVPLQAPDDSLWHVLDLEVECNSVDWECYLSSLSEIEWSPVLAWENAQFGLEPREEPPSDALHSSLRRHIWPWMSQTTVGLAAWHGLLDPAEARSLLRACLPERYNFPFAKRTTPFFAQIGEGDDSPRILPCNVPASLYYFAHALRRYGMASEARDLLLPIYQGMLDRGATTWWEEWNDRSSLCHAWASFVVEFV